MKIGITFAIYNNIDFTLKCLKSIYENLSKNNLYITIVDNASTDNSVQIINSKYPEINIIKNNKNMACAFAWNQGLKDLVENKCDYLILTQNDLIISKDCIDNCVSYLEENKEIDVVSPIAINVPHHSKTNLSQEQLNKIHNYVEKKFNDNIEFSFCFYLFMMRPSVFKAVQFDENFKKALYEDCDFYNNLICNKIRSCAIARLGIVFHKFNSTQSIANNSDPGENSKYFNKKWNDCEIKDKYEKNLKYMQGLCNWNVKYEKTTNHGLDYEKYIEEIGEL